MDALMNILYLVMLGVIQVWRSLMYIITYIGSKAIKWYICKRLNEVEIGIKGTKPDDMMIHNERFYQRIGYDGTLGLGESYIDGWWDSEKLDQFFTKAILAGLYQYITMPWDRLINYLQFNVFNLQTAARSWEVAEKHYDLGKILRCKASLT
jgi:cyclopropane-fatty-acyl-phospholipid synthase